MLPSRAAERAAGQVVHGNATHAGECDTMTDPYRALRELERMLIREVPEQEEDVQVQSGRLVTTLIYTYSRDGIEERVVPAM